MSEDKTELEQAEINSGDIDPPEAGTTEEGVDSSSDIADTDVAELQQQLADAREQVLRSQAEVQNIRRRARIDVENARKFGLEKLVRELLPVVDGLEKAVENFDGSQVAVGSVKEGVEMTLSLLLKGLEKHAVEQLDPHGEPFDPVHHEAMTLIEAPEVEPNSVVSVAQKGYKLNGRLVRPAMVVVSKSTSNVDEKA